MATETIVTRYHDQGNGYVMIIGRTCCQCVAAAATAAGRPLTGDEWDAAHTFTPYAALVAGGVEYDTPCRVCGHVRCDDIDCDAGFTVVQYTPADPSVDTVELSFAEGV